MKITHHEKVIENHFNSIVDKLLNEESPNYYSQKFNIKDLPDCQDFNHSPNMDPMFRYLFEELDTMDKHCLYWFEVKSKEKATELNYRINEYRLNKGKEEYRSIPASNKNNGGTTLYVGIRRGGKTKYGLTNIVGRINQHLGYYRTAGTQGLQLIHCAKDFDCEITLNVVQFEDLQNNMYLNIIEKKGCSKIKAALRQTLNLYVMNSLNDLIGRTVNIDIEGLSEKSEPVEMAFVISDVVIEDQYFIEKLGEQIFIQIFAEPVVFKTWAKDQQDCILTIN